MKSNVFAVIDTNVLVSAMLSRCPDSATVKVLELLFSGKVIPLYNSEILQEYSEVLRRQKFRLPEHLVERILKEIECLGLSMDRTPSFKNFVDLEDAVFYEVALSKEGAFLVTGNTRHFPVSPIVVTPAQFLRLILNR